MEARKFADKLDVAYKAHRLAEPKDLRRRHEDLAILLFGHIELIIRALIGQPARWLHLKSAQ